MSRHGYVAIHCRHGVSHCRRSPAHAHAYRQRAKTHSTLFQPHLHDRSRGAGSRPYKDHQEWKFLAFSAALGEKINASHLALSHTTCRLGQWLETKGEKLIAEKESVNFHHAHKHIHQLGKLVLDYADLKQPERILDLLIEMESASQIVSDTLLNVIEDEFIRLATSDALTGMPNRRSFDIDFEKNIAFAERHNYWVGLVLIDIDHFKKINDELGHLVGDHVLKDVANVIRKTARLEETTYRWAVKNLRS